MFQAIYESSWHIPFAAWAGSLVAMALALRARGFVRAYGAIFAVANALDAWLTGQFSPLSGFAVTVASAVFVIAGDLRFFLAVEHTIGGAPSRVVGRAIGWSIIVPAVSEIARHVWPAIVSTPRVTYLAYELMFLVLAVAFRASYVPRRARGLTGLATFEVAQYALWSAADVVLLSTGSDLGYLLRLVPNAMYYVVFLPFAVLQLRDRS